jgi:superfamily I DNA/RNA helicase
VLYPTKVYKTHPIFRMLYLCCIDVLSANKSPLTKALLSKQYSKESVAKLKQYEFNQLIIEMVSELKEAISIASYDDVAIRVRSNPRMLTIRTHFKSLNTSSNLARLAFRIPPKVIDEIQAMKKSTYGEVVELAIGLYVITCDQQTFDLTYLAFTHFDT